MRNRGATMAMMAQAFIFLVAIVCGPDARQTCSWGSRGGEFGDALLNNIH